METVHESILDDMMKYNKSFKKESYINRRDDEVRAEFKEFYSKNLPIDLLAWSRVNKPDDKMIYKEVYWDQIILIRDTINSMFYPDYKEYKTKPVMVINTHTSKSIELPVYEINLEKYDLKIIMRNNFHGWIISLISNTNINVDFMDLFDENEVINPNYCEGFKKDQVFGCFKDNKKQFTVSIDNKFKIYTFMYLLNNYLIKNNKNIDKLQLCKDCKHNDLNLVDFNDHDQICSEGLCMYCKYLGDVMCSDWKQK